MGPTLFFYVGYTWALTLGYSHVGAKWDPYLFSLFIVFTWLLICSHLGIPVVIPIDSLQIGMKRFMVYKWYDMLVIYGMYSMYCMYLMLVLYGMYVMYGLYVIYCMYFMYGMFVM